MPESKDDKTQDQMTKIIVDGQEVEVTKDELINLAQQGKHYTKSMQELRKKEEALRVEETRVSGLKSIVDEMEADPRLKETLNKVYSDFKSGKISKSDDIKDRNLKLLDRRIEETSDPATREQLKEIREIIKQESPVEEVSSLRNEIKSLREEISIVRNAALVGHNDRTEIQLQKLEEKFGADLVGKYKKDIITLSLKYPATSVNKLLYSLVTDDTEIENALLNQAKKREKEELDRKKRGSSFGASEDSFVSKTELKKDKFGRVTHESLLGRISERFKRK